MSPPGKVLFLHQQWPRTVQQKIALPERFLYGLSAPEDVELWKPGEKHFGNADIDGLLGRAQQDARRMCSVCAVGSDCGGECCR